SAVLAAGLADAAGLGCQAFRAAADELSQRLPLRVALDCLQVVPGSGDPARQEIVGLLRVARGAAAAGLSADPLPAGADRVVAGVAWGGGAGGVRGGGGRCWGGWGSGGGWGGAGGGGGRGGWLGVGGGGAVRGGGGLGVLRQGSKGAGGGVVQLPGLPAESV